METFRFETNVRPYTASAAPEWHQAKMKALDLANEVTSAAQRLPHGNNAQCQRFGNACAAARIQVMQALSESAIAA